MGGGQETMIQFVVALFVTTHIYFVTILITIAKYDTPNETTMIYLHLATHNLSMLVMFTFFVSLW